MSDPTVPATFRIGVDVGGTFTDLVLADSAGNLDVFKVPSVPGDPARGVMNAIDRAAESLALTSSRLLSACALFVHGSTVATNTALERKGAKVGLLATQGFRDSLEIRRGTRETTWDHRTPNPPVLVSRHLRMPVRGRIDRDGRVVEPLSAEDIQAAIRQFEADRVESIAICFINSFANNEHEQAAAARLREAWKGDWISISSAISPLVGEYERTSTTAMNAYVAPRTASYLRKLDEHLRQNGFRHSLLLVQNNGGAMSIEHVAGMPVRLLLSGPAAGVGALEQYRRAIGSNNLISMEIGGTSCDVLLMREGSVATTDQLNLGGYHMSVPAIDIHTIGAGGGTIAGVDEAGMLFVGPHGAGAQPGPAAYGLGGKDPTVTDAQVVLGRLKAGSYAGGSIALDARLAAKAIEERVARPLGLDVETAASGIVRLVEQKLLQAVQRISIERGYDPRRFVLVAAGGAGPMHGASIARQLKCPKVYIPRLSGAFCALGMLHTNVRNDYVRVHFARLEAAKLAEFESIYGDLEREASAFLREAGFASDSIRLTRELDLRYVGQQWDVRVALQGPPDCEAVRQSFEVEHERLFGHRQPSGIVEVTKLRVVALGLLPKPQSSPAQHAAGPLSPAERRRVFVDSQSGWLEVDVYRGSDLQPGHRAQGPLLVEEETTTVLVGMKDLLEVDTANNFVITLP